MSLPELKSIFDDKESNAKQQEESRQQQFMSHSPIYRQTQANPLPSFDQQLQQHQQHHQNQQQQQHLPDIFNNPPIQQNQQLFMQPPQVSPQNPNWNLNSFQQDGQQQQFLPQFQHQHQGHQSQPPQQMIPQQQQQQQQQHPHPMYQNNFMQPRFSIPGPPGSVLGPGQTPIYPQHQPHLTPYPQQDFYPQPIQRAKIPKRRRAVKPGLRRRTMTACESCRLRKIKCDLGKPICGACTKSDLNCVYRNVKKEAEELSEQMSKIAGLEKQKNETPQWSSCNWYTKTEGVLKWPIFEGKYKIKPINTVLAETNEHGLPDLGIITKEQLGFLDLHLRSNIRDYIDNYLQNIQTKNPFIDSKKLLKTSEWLKHCIKENPELSIINLKIPDDLIKLPLILLCCASASITRPLTFTNLENFKSSIDERFEKFEISYQIFMLSEYFQVSPRSKISLGDLDLVQYNLLKATYMMYLIKPWEAWKYIFEASTILMTILESYKDNGRKFEDSQLRIVERVFHTCVKYESELRVELSPSVPASGIVNYPFPSVYPSPPLDSINSVNEESSWFYYLTEIVLRKFENKLLDDFFIPIGKAGNSDNKGEFHEDNYDLNWDSKYDIESIIQKSLDYLKDLEKVENSMITHLNSILKEDVTSNSLQPHGFLFKTGSSINPSSETESQATPPTTSETSTNKISPANLPHQDSGTTITTQESTSPVPLTPSSTTSYSSSDISQKFEKIIPNVPETISFIKTRMIVLKILLFRPLAYLLIHDKSHVYDSHPFVEQVLIQSFENMDALNVPLAVHRHFGSWFYTRNTFLSGILIFALFKRFGEKYVNKSKIKKFMGDVLQILDYWIDEEPDLQDPKKVILGMLEELETL
ncbi:Lysine biosynthesis regulatory protein [Wickerhamomyces ciferrii]|uniref:Lysine biosynthesis regulatory protein n=1 Tax=Wickerhamomyces ciferrii (strain ATCC 14091 / BCRC 22168 / CBS 111 / JCM 3599 / NBRC 0793 / NRRL Y-1031 F-60-10) TaxID=1206466 RepID=K0KMV1_WICCF|nr:Lysine biosynthesis regulatory protein [Wickerhamomyces ciferrii]CCH42694.1 Lysine biosynthesis regulatory protein [Wickerhamomyces ciferrii]